MARQEKIRPKTKRTKHFEEVSLGFSKSDALEEARQFPQLSDHSRDPRCPLQIDIPGFIRILREGDIAGALKKVKEKNDLPAICGRVCSAPCEKELSASEKRNPVGIRALERYVADHGKKWSFNRKKNHCSGKKIAVVGSGPSGLTAAAELAKKNFQVTIFELLPSAGGVLFYGIPSFRLPKDILEKEIEELKYSGVEVKTSSCIGYSISCEEFFKQGFSAVLLAAGTNGNKFVDLPGVYLGGVYYSEEVLLKTSFAKMDFLHSKEPFKLGEKVVVLGASDAALNCARVCIRFGKEVSLISEGPEGEIGNSQKERDYAQEEGIHFLPLRKPLEILSNKNYFVSGLKCMSMDYADPHADGKWLLIPVPDSQMVIEADTVIIASDRTSSSPILNGIPGLKVNAQGTVWLDEKTGMTSCRGLFACGEILTGCSVIIDAMASGKKVAEHIERYLKEGR